MHKGARFRSRERRMRAVVKLFELYGEHCWYCLDHLSPDSATIDHLTPKSRGGAHDISNWRLSCATCNHFKGDMREAEYRFSPRLEERQRAIAKNLYAMYYKEKVMAEWAERNKKKSINIQQEAVR